MSAEIHINLGALKRNWRRLNEMSGPAVCGAAVKANAYGLGLSQTVLALAEAGCEAFFVALPQEGKIAKEASENAHVFVLNGPLPGSDESGFIRDHNLIPVLNSIAQIEDWTNAGGEASALHIDTGMARLGLPPAEVDTLASAIEQIKAADIRMVMSHLAAADRPYDEMADIQKQRFDEARAKLGLGDLPASLANSAGIFRGAEFHYDMVRPGLAIYGGAPLQGQENPMEPVVTVRAQIIQTRWVDDGEPVGYGAAYRAQGKTRIATCALGYGDGYPRALSHQGDAYIDDHHAPIVGRISMDLITLDVTHAPTAKEGSWVTFIGGPISVDQVAHKAGTAPYEILTNLSRRIRRVYQND